MESVAPVTSDKSSEANDSSDSDEEGTSSSEKNARGNLVKNIGDEASVTASDGSTVYSFKVTGITPDAQCTSEYASEPDNGHFVKVDMDVVTGDAKTMEDNFHSSVSISEVSWKYITAEGTTFNGDLWSGASMMCLDDSETLPSSIGPAEKVAGSIILDVPNVDGTLVYEELFANGGWEYAIPQ